jgi:dTDP-4-amino-4,6-dideoxygalactose transaminase
MNLRGFGERDVELLTQVIQSGDLSSLSGEFTPRFEAEFAGMMGTKHAVAMNSAMSVLHASVMCTDAGAGSEVICDSQFIFGPLAALYHNAVPRFVDIDPNRLTIDPAKIEEAVNERTRAIIVVHSWGLPADMDPIMEIARKYNLIVIEDIAHAIYATYKGKYTGNLGHIGSFSFQASKQMSLGDGGMATTNDDELAEKLDLNAGAPTFGSVAYGLHYNYRMTELASAVGLAQLERLPKFISHLQKIGSIYYESVQDCDWLPLQQSEDSTHTYHFWVANFRGEDRGISMEDFRRVIAEQEANVWMGYTNIANYQQPVIKDKMAHAFHCSDNSGLCECYDGLCPVAEWAIPRTALVYTVIPEDDARQGAENLRKTIDILEGR